MDLFDRRTPVDDGEEGVVSKLSERFEMEDFHRSTLFDEFDELSFVGDIASCAAVRVACVESLESYAGVRSSNELCNVATVNVRHL